MIPATPEQQSTDNTTLTPNRRKRDVENHDYGAFVRRVLRAYARRVASGDIEALADLAALETDITNAIHAAATNLHTYGYSWADIARPLGVTRQAAQQRFGGEPR